MTIVAPNRINIQNSARLTLIGDATIVPQEEFDNTFKIYTTRFPSSSKYKEFHDFNIYRLSIVKIRFIGGFGKIFWVPREDYLSNYKLSRSEFLEVIEHMNTDHHDFLVKLLKRYKFTINSLETVRLVHVQRKFLTIQYDSDVQVLEFQTEASTIDELRERIIQLL